MADLRGRPVNDLSDDELFCFAARVEESGDRETALSLFEALMRRETRPGRAHFSVGRLLLESGDEAGIAMIDEVTQALPKTTIPGCELIIRYLLASGRESEARPYIDRYRQCQEAELDAAGLRDRD